MDNPDVIGKYLFVAILWLFAFILKWVVCTPLLHFLLKQGVEPVIQKRIMFWNTMWISMLLILVGELAK